MSASITLLKNGPIKVEGEFQLMDSFGKPLDTPSPNMAYLCRCGQSTKKPFCDGGHAKCGFSSTVEAAR